MPFTFVTFVIGALALAGFPLMSGFFSKDEIIAFTSSIAAAGSWSSAWSATWPPVLTAFYAFRMVFRIFFGDPVPEARELERRPHRPRRAREPRDRRARGHRRRLPRPRAPHRRAVLADEGRDGPLAVLAVIGGAVGIPGLTNTLEHFLEPTFADSRYIHDVPTDTAEWDGLGVGGIISRARHRRRPSCVFVRRRRPQPRAA